MSAPGRYTLLDSGRGRRLEEVGPYRLVRPAPQAFWAPRLPDEAWERADGIYLRHTDGGGQWKWNRRVPEAWPIEVAGLNVFARPTGFGHIGFFPEQALDWDFLTRAIGAAARPLEAMNLFGYTGMSSLVMAQAGARVCHLDASKGVVAWARENAAAAGLAEAPIRWMVEDALKFLDRESRRGHLYHGFTISPPSFGRGAKGEVWKIEEDLPDLLARVRRLSAPDLEFVTLNTNSPKFTPLVLAALLDDAFADLGGVSDGRELTVADTQGRVMPNGAYAAWWRRGKPFSE